MTAIIDVYSRKILSWGFCYSISTLWYFNVLNDALEQYGAPEIINTDQGSQYTSVMWTQYLEKLNVKISMDGKGRATDNIWIQCLWKSFKNDYVYLNPCDDGFELMRGAQNHIENHNNKPHHTTKQKPNNRHLASLNLKTAKILILTIEILT